MYWQVRGRVAQSICDCKKRKANQGVSDNIGQILIYKEVCTSWMKTNCNQATRSTYNLSVKSFAI